MNAATPSGAAKGGVLALFSLALRRALAPWVWLLGSAVLFLALRLSSDIRADAATTRALARTQVWIPMLLLLGPLLGGSAALAARRWRTGEASWIGARPLARLSAALAVWLAQGAAAWIVLGAIAIAAEGKAARTAPAAGLQALRFARALPQPAGILLERDEPLRWSVPAADLGSPASGAQLTLALCTAPGSGPVVDVRWSARRETGASRERVARVDGWTELHLPLADGGGALEIELELDGAGAILVVPEGALALLEPASSDALASLELALRAALASLAWCALALGLSTCVAPWIAGTLVTLVAWLPLEFAHLRPVWPGGGLVEALEWTERGVVPAHLPLSELAAGLAACVFGLGLARRALANGGCA
jgi:hypothetical protein